MAAAADLAEGLLASKAGRALAFAASFSICLLAAGMLAITLLGHVHRPTIVLDQPETAENTPKPPTSIDYYISDDGRKPMTGYAAPADIRAKFKIAIVVSGLGLSSTASKAALDSLPAAVTLAFEAYAGDVGQWVAEARQHVHEILLKIPMEPFDFPDSDPGPHTLRAG